MLRISNFNDPVYTYDVIIYLFLMLLFYITSYISQKKVDVVNDTHLKYTGKPQKRNILTFPHYTTQYYR